MIAGAGTGKTRVIVERVKWLLDTKPDLVPEQTLVLTYNVKAARELQTRIEGAVGPAVRARITVGNFHSFCHRILTESAAEADLPPNPDVLDGIGQLASNDGLRPDEEACQGGQECWQQSRFPIESIQIALGQPQLSLKGGDRRGGAGCVWRLLVMVLLVVVA